MNINLPNSFNNVSFSAKNKNIRRADDIMRATRKTFPALSTSYIDHFYYTTKNNLPEEKATRFDYLYEKLEKNLEDVRNSYSTESTMQAVKYLKAANCHEFAMETLAALAANGYRDSKRYTLAVETVKTDKETGKDVFFALREIDHTFIITKMLNDKNYKEEEIIVDTWLGFADSISGAEARYKSIFPLKNTEEETDEFSSDDSNSDDSEEYTTHAHYVYLCKNDGTDINSLAEHIKETYPELIIKSNND